MAFGVKANIRAPHRFMRMGTLVWVILINPGWAGERIMVIGLSHGGRKVKTWIDARDLTNYRAGWAPEDIAIFETRQDAEAWANRMNERFTSDPVRPHAAKFSRPRS